MFDFSVNNNKGKVAGCQSDASGDIVTFHVLLQPSVLAALAASKMLLPKDSATINTCVCGLKGGDAGVGGEGGLLPT